MPRSRVACIVVGSSPEDWRKTDHASCGDNKTSKTKTHYTDSSKKR